MTTIWIFLFVLIIIILLYFFLKKSNNKNISNTNLTTTSTESALNCLNKSNLTIRQLDAARDREMMAAEVAQKYACVKRGYDFSCESTFCKCIITNQEQCSNYAQELLNPTYYSEKDISDSRWNYNVFWDNKESKCIKVLIGADSGACKILNEIESTGKFNEKNTYFSFVRADLSCNDDYCDILRRSTCEIPREYCTAKGMDYDSRNYGNCYVSRAQEIGEFVLGQEFMRCAKAGNIDCVIDSINPITAIADIICNKKYDMKGGCGIPGVTESFVDLYNYIGPYVQEAFEKGWSATKEWFEGAAGDVADWFKEDFVEFWTEDIPKFAESYFTNMYNDFKDAGITIYDNVLLPIANWFKKPSC
jgi:hypothetical protein